MALLLAARRRGIAAERLLVQAAYCNPSLQGCRYKSRRRLDIRVRLFATNENKKKRTKRARPQLRPSEKDRIRTITSPTPKPIIHHVEQAANFLELRLREAQSIVRGFWNREGTTTNKSPEMDRWWWTWNIVLALSPAAAIAITMELWGKSYVDKRNKEIEEFQRNKLGLLSDDEEEEAYANIKTGNSITSILGGGAAEIPVSQTPSQQVTIKHAPQEGSTTVDASNGLTAAPAIAAGDMSIEALAQRLQWLEQKLERQDRLHEHQRKYQHQRQNQSGIQNRIEDKLLLQEEKDVLKQKQHKLEVANSTNTGTVSSSPTIFDFAFATMQDNVRAKGEAVVDFGKSVLDPARESTTNSTSSSTNRYPSLAAEKESSVQLKANVVDATQSAQETAQHTLVVARAAQQVSNDVFEQIQRQQKVEQPISSSWASSWSKIFGAGSSNHAKPSDVPTGQPGQV